MAVSAGKTREGFTFRVLHAAAPKPLTETPAARYVWAVARLALGWVFVWAFVDKLFGLGHETPSAQAWIEGGSPTTGFLKNSPQGPFARMPR